LGRLIGGLIACRLSGGLLVNESANLTFFLLFNLNSMAGTLKSTPTEDESSSGQKESAETGSPADDGDPVLARKLHALVGVTMK
jgi:hypothetical protein